MKYPHSKSESLLGSFLSSYSRSRRLDDRIRRLCNQAVEVTDPAELNAVLKQLTAALREHGQRMRNLAVLLSSVPPDRRSA